MREVYSPANQVEAHMMVHMLEQSGIAAHIHGRALEAASGELPAAALIRVMVADEDYERARKIIADWEASNTSAAETPMPKIRVPIVTALACLAIGGVAGWVAANHSAGVPFISNQEKLDTNGDGRPDIIYHYSIGGARAFRMDADTNFDGVFDDEYTLDANGSIATGRLDVDFDGRKDTQVTYRFGVIESEETDTDGDGVVDIVRTFKDGGLASQEIRKPGSDKPARVNTYDAFRMIRSESDLDGDGTLETIRTYDPLGEVLSTETRRSPP